MLIPKSFLIGLLIASILGFIWMRNLGKENDTLVGDKDKFKKDEHYRFSERIKTFFMPILTFVGFYVLYVINENSYQY